MTPDPIKMLAVIDQNEAAIREYFEGKTVEQTIRFMHTIESLTPRELLIGLAAKKAPALFGYNVIAHTTGVHLQQMLTGAKDHE